MMEKRNVATSVRAADEDAVESAIQSATKCIAAANGMLERLGRSVKEAAASAEATRRAMAEDERAERAPSPDYAGD